MRGKNLKLLAGLLVVTATQVQARSAIAFADSAGGAPAAPIPGVLQCVPYARDTSGIRLFGDAHTWWQQAEGKYARGRAPKPGAVMAIRPHGGSSLGHVATVSRVVDARTILINHANWSAPGKIERNVTAVDVSPANDWSEVRVWYAPIQSLGGAHWPVAGFIYNATSRKPSKAAAPSTLTRFVPSKTVKVRFGYEPLPVGKAPTRVASSRVSAKQAGRGPATKPLAAAPRLAKLDTRKDPIGAILARSR